MYKVSKVLVAVLVFSVAFSFDGFAQRKKKKDAEVVAADTVVKPATVVAEPVSVNAEMKKQKQIFDLALKYSDAVVAKQAMFEMMVLDPSNAALKDSLAMLYFNLGSYAECILVTREILAAKPNDLVMMELRAESLKKVGMYREALGDFEKIYLQTHDVRYKYEIANLHYDLNQLNECNLSLDILLKSSEIDKEQISLAISRMAQQTVPMRAAVLNLKGIVAADMNNIELAKKSYTEALKIFPDFVLAKANLETIKKSAASVKKK